MPEVFRKRRNVPENRTRKMCHPIRMSILHIYNSLGEIYLDGCDKIGRVCNVKNNNNDCTIGGDTGAICDVGGYCICTAGFSG